MSDSNGTTPKRASALELGPKKKPYVVRLLQTQSRVSFIYLSRCLTDPLVHHGRHFGRTVHSLCNVPALLTHGLLRLGEMAEEPEESFNYECVYHSIV